MIVADTNLIAYLLISGEWTQQAEAVKRQDSEWAAPLLWRSEFRNLLSLYIRREIFDLDHAINLLRNAEEIMQEREHTITRTYNFFCVGYEAGNFVEMLGL